MNISAEPSVGNLSCPEYSEDDFIFLDAFSFWVEGVLQTTLAVLGIVGNSIASVIISRKEMRNAFNLLLVSLACFDSTYLFGSILESIRKDFNMASQLHIILFPHLLYPFNQVAVTGSIFMTVAIAWERYVAVHYPLDYNQAMNDSNAMRKRLVKYVGPVTLLAFAFNIVKFFEANVEYRPLRASSAAAAAVSGENNSFAMVPVGGEDVHVVTRYEVFLEVAEMRTHPVYTVYNNWSRLLVLGIIPFLLLVFFNTKIYNDIVERRRRRLRTNRVRRGTDSNIDSDDLSLVSHNIESTVGDLNNAVAARKPSWRRKRSQRLSGDANNGDARRQSQKRGGGGGGGGGMTLQRYRSSLKRWSLSRTTATAKEGYDEQQKLPTVRVTTASGDRDAECHRNPVGNSRKESSSNGTTTTTTTAAAEPEDAKGRHSGPSVEETAFTGEDDGDKHGGGVPDQTSPPAPGGSDRDPPTADAAAAAVVAKNNDDGPRATAADPALLMVSSSRDPSASFRLRRRRVQNINERRRRFEDNLAAIFMGFVLVFLVCHFPRLLLNIHELITLREAMVCMEDGRQGFSLWSMVLITISHVLLVLNSSINILIYCLLSSKFREECRGLVKKLSSKRTRTSHTSPETNLTAT